MRLAWLLRYSVLRREPWSGKSQTFPKALCIFNMIWPLQPFCANWGTHTWTARGWQVWAWIPGPRSPGQGVSDTGCFRSHATEVTPTAWWWGDSLWKTRPSHTQSVWFKATQNRSCHTSVPAESSKVTSQKRSLQFSTATPSKLQPTGRIRSHACFHRAGQLRIVFTFSSSRKKKSKEE